VETNKQINVTALFKCFNITKNDASANQIQRFSLGSDPVIQDGGGSPSSGVPFG